MQGNWLPMGHRKVTTIIAQNDSALCLDDAESDRVYLSLSFMDHILESIFMIKVGMMMRALSCCSLPEGSLELHASIPYFARFK